MTTFVTSNINTHVMINAEQAREYIKPFEPSKDLMDELERQIKSGNRHPMVYTTRLARSYAEDVAKYCREKLGFTNARIVDIYNQRTGERGGNYLKIDL